MSIHQALIKSHVTAVEIIPGFVFAGTSNTLQVHNLRKNEVTNFQIFQKQRIHGIRFDVTKNELVCFGNRNIAFLQVSLENDFRVIFINHLFVGDWIWDVKWSNEEMIVLCASNTASLWNWKREQNSKVVINRVKCLLYSGIIIGNEWDECIILAGTMFKSILIWAPSTETNGSCSLLHKLTGHTGAIFSLFYHEKLRRICSTSDDRSVRIWSVCAPENCSKYVESWRQASISLVITVYGHVSRVWKSIVFDNGGFLTAGEDGQLRLWNESGKPVCSWITHQGASIRSVSVDEAEHTIVTGGGDGGIHLWPLPQVDKASEAEKVERIRFNTILGLTKVQDIPRRIVLSRAKKLFTVTNQGYLLCYDHSSWQCVVKDDRFADYCLLQVSKDRRCISLASIHGDVMILRECDEGTMTVIHDDNICASKIFSFHWLDSSSFVTCSEQGRVEVWALANDDSSSVSKIRKVRTLSLPPCKEWWSTSALRVDDAFVIGDRDGSLHAYCNRTEPHPTQTFKRIHGRLGVSHIGDDDANGGLFSVGRGGYVRYWRIRENSVHLLASHRLPIKWPVQVLRTNSYGSLVMGFNEVNFEIWDIVQRKKLLSIACGGGHRPWDFSLSDDIGFVFIKKDVVYKLILSANRLKVLSLSEGFHIRETECLKCLNENTFVSGGEDTTLRIFRIEAQCQLKTLTIMRSHVSSIKAISFVLVNDTVLVVSVGGRAQLNVYRIRTEPTVTYEELASHMIKSDDRCKKLSQSVISALDLEPRYMDVDLHIMQNDTNTLFIYCAGSDSVWRVFAFDLETESLRVHKEVEYANFCVLKIVRISWAGREFVVTFSSDGAATFWDAQSFTVVSQKTLHLSGINSYDHVVSDHELILATGGDDANVKLSTYKCEFDRVDQIDCVSGNLHAANVTGLKIVSNYIISVSCDQKVIVWQWSLNDSKLQQLCLVRTYHSMIPDIRGFEIVRIDGTQSVICIYGVGFQTLVVELP